MLTTANRCQLPRPAGFSLFWLQAAAVPGRQNSKGARAMRIKMDTSMIRFMITKLAEPKMDREAGQQKVDRLTGALLWQLQLMALDETGGEILTVTVDTEPKFPVGEFCLLYTSPSPRDRS